MSSNYYKDKIVWITGASSGIGEALAKHINAVGGIVLLSARTKENLERTQQVLSQPERSYIFPMDVCHQDEVNNTYQTIISTFHKVDILIQNAGVSQRSKIIDTAYHVYEKLIQMNYLSLVYLTKLILPDMIKNQGGQIIVISSLAGKVGAPMRSGYSASKHALHGFFDCLRVEHEKDNIKVNIMCPGYTKTKIAHNALNASGEKNNTEDEEINQGMEPADLAMKICRAAAYNKHESYFGGKEVNSVLLKKLFPGLLHRILVKRNSKH